MKQHPIGIIDSGIGGFTVAKAVAEILPREDILYLGDGANAPYGNRTGEELVKLAKYMVDFMEKQQVKLLLVACNTISCLHKAYEDHIHCPVLYVVKSGAVGVCRQATEKIGVISTQFTHQQGVYCRYIQEIAPEKQVFSQGSTHLVRLIEGNQGDKASETAIVNELKAVVSPLVAEGIGSLVLGCTHYPLVMEQLQNTFPDLMFSDPAQEMARQTQDLLTNNNLLNTSGGILTVYTTGDTQTQAPHLKRAGLQAESVQHLAPLKL